MDKGKEQNYNAKEAGEFLINALSNAIHNGKQTFLCSACAHKEVCSKIEESGDKCKYFMDNTGPQKYPSIYHLFQPIFDWIKIHYPAGEVKFIVDHNSAKMVMDHGPFVLSEELQKHVDNAQKGNMEQKSENV